MNSPPIAERAPSASKLGGSKLGVFIIGARGSVATTAIVGTRAIAAGLATSGGMVTDREPFSALALAPVADFIFGGIEIRSIPLSVQAAELARQGVFSPNLVAPLQADLDATDARIVPGFMMGEGAAVAELAEPGFARPVRTGREGVESMRSAIAAFASNAGCSRLVVINLASTEPACPDVSALASLAAFERALDQKVSKSANQLPASTIHAYAAISEGHPYVNFTPSIGASCLAIAELAEARGIPYAGRDGKTGETLLKTVLAPMFVARNLRIASWQGYNMLGNSDGAVLRHPANLESKITSKDIQLRSITGHEDIHTAVRIDYVPSLGEWKTAWDFIHFRGFLGTMMELHFTWKGCDSTLAAPLVLDLARLVDEAAARGARGALVHLAAFFKNPDGVDEHDFARQMHRLHEYAGSVGIRCP